MLSLAGVHSIKRIEVAIKPFELEAVKESLSELGVGAMTVSEVHQLASSTTAPRVYRGSAYVADFAVMLRIEVVAPAD
ncbi:MAG TPA: P-II family nitrogen regulator, partial [Polyangiaceae bacterium]